MSEDTRLLSRIFSGHASAETPRPAAKLAVARPVHPRLSSTRHHLPKLTADSWVSAPKAPDWRGDLPVHLFGKPASIARAFDWVNGEAQDVSRSADLHSIEDYAALAPSGGVFMVWIDDFGGITRTIEVLYRLRRAAPRLTVIIVTEDVAVDDTSVERLAICDATLRAPVSPLVLEGAIDAAMVNTKVWESRQSALR